MRYIPLLGRFLYSATFIASGFNHFRADSISYAAGQGVPMATFLVPVSGLLAILGGFSILLGWKARTGAWMIVLFLVPVTFMMHRFWNLSDPMFAMQQQAHFMKNLSMLGGAFLIAYFGSGPVSLRPSPRELSEKKPAVFRAPEVRR